MTQRQLADGVFVKFGNAKFEIDKQLAQRFANACKQAGVKQLHVFRHIIWEFCEQVEKRRI